MSQTTTTTTKPKYRDSFNSLGKALRAWEERHGYTQADRENAQRNFGRKNVRKGGYR
jgi:hypothetical protein